MIHAVIGKGPSIALACNHLVTHLDGRWLGRALRVCQLAATNAAADLGSFAHSNTNQWQGFVSGHSAASRDGAGDGINTRTALAGAPEGRIL